MVRLLLFVALCLPFEFGSAAKESNAAKYDPLAINSEFRVPLLELTVRDEKRSRDIPVRIYLPESAQPEPVVLFSHGLGGSRNGNEFLGKHWAARGYVAVFVQHPGSDTSVWKDKLPDDRMRAMREAASLENFELRAADVPAVLDQLEVWNANDQRLHGSMNLQKIGMSGHSFGAITTQAVSGETFPIIGKKLTDLRIKAAIAFSPSAPSRSSAGTAFADVKIPWLLMTGTKDIASIGHADMKSRLAVYPALRGAPKYEVVLNNAEHSAFTDRALPGDSEPRNPNHHRVMCALTTAFLDSYLRDDSAALGWLNGEGPRSIMESADRWQFSSK
jgi:predicted dienelactone hydrolase